MGTGEVGRLPAMGGEGLWPKSSLGEGAQGACLGRLGPEAPLVSWLLLSCEVWLGLGTVGQQGRSSEASGGHGPAPQELLSEAWSSFGHIRTNSGSTSLPVSATFGCGVGAGATEGVGGYVMNRIKWTDWTRTVCGDRVDDTGCVRECLRNRGPHEWSGGPVQEEEG